MHTLRGLNSPWRFNVRSMKLLGFLLAASCPAVGVQPIASITSVSPFELRGHTVNVEGVPTWPLAAGDDIATGKDTATVQFRDGARIVLLQNSHLRLDFKDDKVQLH